jgi:hypothetical protein
MRRVPALLLCGLLLSLLAACSGTVNVGSPESSGPGCQAPGLRASDRLNRPLVLTAQSVPTASLVPCLYGLPSGWVFRGMDARKGQTRVILDFGMDTDTALTITLTRRCDVRGAIPSPAGQPSVRRYDRILETKSGYRADRYAVFKGGCVTYRFALHGRAGNEPAATISRTFGFVDRDTLRRSVHDYSDGRFELDPDGSG